MLAKGKIPMRGGLWVDAYNQCVSTIAGTIRARVDGCNMFYVTEMKRRFTPPRKWKHRAMLSTDKDGCAVSITTRSGCCSLTNFIGTQHYPMTGVLEVYGKSDNKHA